MPNNFQRQGAQSPKPTRFSAIYTEEFFSGLVTQRSPLRDAGSRAERLYFGTRGDALIDGSNIEISNRLTPIRRPGCSVYNSNTFPAIDAFYEFRLFNTNTETVRVMADTAATLYNATAGNIIPVWTKSVGAGQTYMQGIANILYFGNGVDQIKWVQNPQGWQPAHNYTINEFETFFIDPNGNVQQLVQTVIPITEVQVAADVLTITFNQNVTSILTSGLTITFLGVATATFLNDVTSQTIVISNVSGTTITAPFVHPNYGPASDTGNCYVVEGGTPLSSISPPTWNTVPAVGGVGGQTIDNTAVWVNRGTPLYNWGLAGPTQQEPTVVVNTNTNSWKPDTYYSQLGGIIDSNGNFQTITTPGKSGSYGMGGHPTWNTSPSGTTTDGTVTWTLTQTATQMTWEPNTTYANGQLIAATPAGGVPSVFQLQPFTAAQLSGNVTAYVYPKSHTVGVGACTLSFPTTTGSASGSATNTSLLFDINPSPGGGIPINWATLNSAGVITGSTTPFPSFVANYNLVVVANLIIPEPGNYTISINHGDGMFFGIGGGATPVSGPTNDPFNNTQTAVNGYPVFGGTNQTASGGPWKEQFVANFPTAGTYPIEIDYAYWYHSGQTLTVYINGVTPVPAGGTPTNRTSGANAPNWPNFTTSQAPGYASVSEANGQLFWYNIGYVTDFGWVQNTNYISTDTIVDNNGYVEFPYEAGTTSELAPTFTKTLNGLTSDNPNLLWINQGRSTVTPAGNINTFDGGWSYAIALVNTLTDTVSDTGPVTVATGSFLGASGVTLTGGLPANPDPQADYVAIFRTDDGGSTYYLIPSSGNANQNTPYTLPLQDYIANGYVDTTLDSGLNIEIEGATAEQNLPPPVGIINIAYHLGRIFGSVGNVVQWSSGPDTPVGNGNEGFPPLNSATFPSLVKCLTPTSIGLIVNTVSDIYLIAGQGTTSSPFVSVLYSAGVGLLSYNNLWINGGLIYFLTADNELVVLDPHAGIKEIGFAIGDKLDNFNPATGYVTYHVNGSKDRALYISDGSTGWYRLITTPSPETGETWAPFATIQGGTSAVQSIETTPGVKNLLIGPKTSGPILKRDLNTWADNGVPYTAYGTIGSIVLAEPGQIAEVVFITTDAPTNGGAEPVSISVLIDEISGNFETLNIVSSDPPQLPASSTLQNLRFWLSSTQEPAICRHLQLKFSWPAENFASELYTVTIFGGYQTELS